MLYLNSKYLKFTIFLNIILIAIVDYAFVKGMILRFYDYEFSKMPYIVWGYNTVALVIIFWSFLVIFGLFKKYVWARLFAIYFNVIVVFFWGILKLIPIFMGVDFFYVYSISEVLLDCFIVLFAISLIVFYSLKPTRNLFKK